MISSNRQLDLLTDWTPPPATVRFDDTQVRAATMEAQISRAVATALRDCPDRREDIAKRMGEFLAEKVTVNMVNAYASQARADHAISLPRFIALLSVTRDRRLLQFLAEMMGWAVIEQKHLPLIELAAVQEKLGELQAAAAALRRKARGALACQEEMERGPGR